MDNKLEPCPFCDHKVLMPHVHSRSAKTAGGYHYFVRCPRCHTEGPRSLSGKDDAIAAWNSRAGDRPDYKPEYKTLTDHRGRVTGVQWVNAADAPAVGSAATSPAPAVVQMTDLNKAILAAREALEKISVWKFGWDGDCGVTRVADDALEAIDAALALAPAQKLAEDTELLNWFDQHRTAYGFEGIQEGNEWLMNGPFPDLRSALRECKAHEEKQRAAKLAQSADKAEE